MQSTTSKNRPQLQILSWVSFIGLLGAILVYAIVPVANARDRLEFIPSESHSFNSVEIPFTQEEKDFLRDAHAIKRLYSLSDGNTLMMLVVDGAEDRHVVHNPVFCIKGAGDEILSEESMPLVKGSGSKLKIKTDSGFQEMAYWYSTLNRRHSSFANLLWDNVLNRLSFGTATNAPVMVVLYSSSNKSINWNRVPDQLPFLMSL